MCMCMEREESEHTTSVSKTDWVDNYSAKASPMFDSKLSQIQKQRSSRKQIHLEQPVNPTLLGWKDKNHGDAVLDKPPDNEVILRRSIFTCPTESDQFIGLQWTPPTDKHNPDSKSDDLYSQRHNSSMKSSTTYINYLLIIRVKALSKGHQKGQILGTQNTYDAKGLQKIKGVILSRTI